MITTKDVRTAASLLAAIGHPVRLSLLNIVVEAGRHGVALADIARALAMPKAGLSNHLRMLEAAGLVRRALAAEAVTFQVQPSGLRRLDAALVTTRKMLHTTAPPEMEDDTASP